MVHFSLFHCSNCSSLKRPLRYLQFLQIVFIHKSHTIREATFPWITNATQYAAWRDVKKKQPTRMSADFMQQRFHKRCEKLLMTIIVYIKTLTCKPPLPPEWTITESIAGRFHLWGSHNIVLLKANAEKPIGNRRVILFFWTAWTVCHPVTRLPLQIGPSKTALYLVPTWIATGHEPKRLKNIAQFMRRETGCLIYFYPNMASRSFDLKLRIRGFRQESEHCGFLAPSLELRLL